MNVLVIHNAYEETIIKLRAGLIDAINDLEASGYYYDHPQLVRLRKIIDDVVVFSNDEETVNPEAKLHIKKGKITISKKGNVGIGS